MAVRGRTAWLSAGVLVLFVAVALEPAGPRHVARPAAGARPRLGEACQVVDRHPVTFSRDSSGAWVASFALAGGATEGHVPVPAVEASMVADYDAYVADVRLGSYEPAAGGRRGGLVCALDPTYHFTCPAGGGVDRFCITWVRRSGPQPALATTRPRTSSATRSNSASSAAVS